jgi:predicted MFS family arabinose efflux permease
MSKRILPYAMWVFPLAFFTYQFIPRLWPSLMMQQIMQQFQIDATDFGLLASIYYYGYAGMLLPIAVLLDRYGARYVIFICAVTCGLATLLFTYTTNWHLALLSRFLVGVGSGAGFLATSKVISQWFGREYYARMIGFSFTVGLLGGIYGGKPVSLMVERFGWQQVAYVLALVSIGIGVLTLLFLKSKNALEKTEDPICLKDFGKLLTSPTIWLLGIANLLMVGSLEGFTDVWGLNYLMAATSLSKSDAAGIVSYVFVGMLFGGPLLVAAAKRFGNYGVITGCSVGMVLAFVYLLADDLSSAYILSAIFFGVGVLCCYQVLMFATGSELVAPAMLGITVAFLNCINMLGGSFFHSAIGFGMDFFWTGLMSNGIRQYTAESYQKALMIIPVAAVVGGVIVAMLGSRRWKMVSTHDSNKKP